MKKIVLFLSVILFSLPLRAQTDFLEQTDDVLMQNTLTAGSVITDLPWPQNVQQELDLLIDGSELLQTSQLGLYVWDLTADSAIYRHNHRQTMRPASTMKLVTAIAALHHLGTGYQFSTSLYCKGQTVGRTFTGDLTVVGGMDPAFDITDLRDFAYQVHHQLGIDTLRGRIVADVSVKDTLKWGEGWCWDDDNYTLSPLLVNKKANLPERFVAELARSGVVVQDDVSVVQGYRSSDARLLCTCRHSIDAVLQKMMKESDNLYAEAVFYNLAASYGSRPARAIYARTLIKQLVNHLGLRSDDYRFADGSGLSLYDYVSPQLMVALLRYAWQQPALYAHLLPSLPIAGEDGTLKKRMKNTAAEGNVRAKTGTVTGISSLAGYCTAANGHQLCFCIINQGVMHGRDGRNFQDRVCTMLCQ